MYKIFNQLVTFIVSLVVIMLGASYTLAHDISENSQSLSSYEKLFLEERLGKFLQQVDSYDGTKQDETYQQLQEKVLSIKSNYDVKSRTYIILQIVYELATHKLNTQYSSTQILNHILFSEHLPELKINSTDNSGEISKNPIATEKEIVRQDYNSNRLNEVDKNIVAGEKKGVFDIRIRADLEPIQSESVEFIFNQNIDAINLRGRIFLDGVLIGDINDSSTNNNSLMFGNLQDFIIPTNTSYLQLELVPFSIGKDQVGQAINNLFITQTLLKDNSGIISGDTISTRTLNEDSKNINIVPVDLQVELVSEFEKNMSTARIYISPLKGKNNDNGDDFSTHLTRLDIQVSSFQQAGEISIFNNRGTLIGNENIIAAGNYSIDLTPDSISDSGEEYSIVTSAQATFRMTQDSLGYTAGIYNLESKLKKQIILGQR